MVSSFSVPSLTSGLKTIGWLSFEKGKISLIMLSSKNLYSTGNILSLNELKKKAGLNSRDELIEVLKITLKNFKGKGDSLDIRDGIDISLANIDRKEMKITVKFFLFNSDTEVLKEALNEVCVVLNTDKIESVIIFLYKCENADDILPILHSLWTVLEDHVTDGKLISIGVSDIETEKFIELFNQVNIKPNIVQINLATCCIVPPALQEFTKRNDIQLLTHSDPSPILTDDIVTEFFGDHAKLSWVARYQVHLRCRGVLSSKGYLIRIIRSK